MLNETYLLQRALEQAALTIPRQHPRIKLPGRTSGPCLRVCLDNQSQVSAVESVTEDEWPGIWTIREGKQNSFPVVRIGQPLYDVPREDTIWNRLGYGEEGMRKKRPIDDRLAIITDVITDTPQLFSQRSEQLWRRLTEKAQELHQCATGEVAEDRILREFAQHFLKATENPSQMLKEVGSQALHQAHAARIDDFDAIEILFVGKGPPGPDGKRPGMTIQLAFDLKDAHRGIYTKDVRERLKQILPTKLTKSTRNRATVIEHPASACALTNGQGPLQVEPFPQVKLPVLNEEFALFSMFSEAPCNTRYGLTDRLIMPVATEAALRMQDALTWIITDMRKGQTWRPVASGKYETRQGRKVERSDLLIVYVDGKPDIHANVADLFGTDESEQQKQFEVDAQAICQALDGFEKKRPGSKVNLFLLRKASKGQAHVAVAESPTVKEVLDAVSWWQRGVKNLPDVSLPLPGKKGEKALQGRPRTPFPDQVVRLLSTQWVTNGTRSNKAEGIGLRQVLDLMLCKPGKWETTAERMLDLTLHRLNPLLLGVFGAMHTADLQRWKPYTAPMRETALRAVSVLGILLDALSRRKETYMSETAFLIGRLLSSADTLHREYCEHVRGGNIPPQLIGNAHMPVAADNPEDAMDRLRERMNIYIAWAQKGRGEEFRLAKWVLGQIGKISNQLPRPLPTETDRTFRAELFLGYLARSVHQASPNDDKDSKSNEVEE